MKQIVLRVEESAYEILKNAIPQLKGVCVMECVDVKATEKYKSISTENDKKALADSRKESFTDRVKAIVRKAASKNGQRIETKSRGHSGAYTFYINDECFCAAIDEMEEVYPEKMLEYLGGSIWNLEAKKVCPFIGRVIKMNIINNEQMQLNDVSFALEDYFKSSTVKSSLSRSVSSDEAEVLLGTFKGILKKHIS